MKAIQVSINRSELNKQRVAYSYHEILFTLKKEKF
jgi:hypothetical protein